MGEGKPRLAERHTIDDFVTKDGNRTEFDREKALAYLLTEEVVFVNSRPYVKNPEAPKDKQEIGGETVIVFVNSNDVFAWAAATAETVATNYDNTNTGIEKNELYRLLSYVLEDGRWGSTKYACWKRNLQPQKPLVAKLKEEGVWDDWWDALPAFVPKT